MLNNAKVIQFFFKAISYYDQFWTYTLILPGNRSLSPIPAASHKKIPPARPAGLFYRCVVGSFLLIECF